MKICIVIPVMNKLHFTKQCLDDLNETTNKTVEIIVIDNASTDGTGDYLATQKKILVISNSSNMGCAFSWNQGIKASNSDWIVILNNDVRLSKKWLDNLIEQATKNHTDVISPGMREGELDYDFNKYAETYTAKMKNVFRECTPSGVCFAVKSFAFNKIGLFDENYHIGQYEDADFFRRCKKLNFKMGITGGSFIHHYGSTTQKHIQARLKNDYSSKNRIYHREKWKIGFIQRHYERYRDQLRTFYWSRKELLLYHHSLLEKGDCGKIKHF
jgi:N-acetylglucosaminyl-diphospho-decaprenol L-rhamnosyltransferase